MRDPEIFYPLFTKLREELKKEYKLASQKLALFSLLLNNCHRNQASYFGARDITKLNFLFGLNLLTAEPGGIAIHFGQGHDSKYGDSAIKATPPNKVSIMDRGFSSFARVQGLLREENRYFVLRIKNNIALKMLESGKLVVGTGEEKVEVRVVNFCC